jgi:hypothetical protein
MLIVSTPTQTPLYSPTAKAELNGNITTAAAQATTKVLYRLLIFFIEGLQPQELFYP